MAGDRIEKDSPSQTNGNGPANHAGANPTNGSGTGLNVPQTGTQAAGEGLLFESGDRWLLDTLIPNRDRLLVGPQVPRTSKPTVATKPVLVKGTLNPECDHYRNYVLDKHSAFGTGSALDLQRSLRDKYQWYEPLPDDNFDLG